METDPKCKCNCHDREFREFTGANEHKNCDICKKELAAERKELAVKE